MTEPNPKEETQATFCNAISPSGFGCSLSPGHTGPHVAEGTHDGDYEEWAKSAVAPDPRNAELSALRKQLESSQGTISEYRRVVHRNSDDLREMVEEVRAAKRERDAAQTAARQAGEEAFLAGVDEMRRQVVGITRDEEEWCRGRMRNHDGGEEKWREGVGAALRIRRMIEIRVVDVPTTLLSLPASAPAETPGALCVCGHQKSKHRPNGVCYHQCGPYLTCNCGKFEAFAPPVAPSAPATTGEALNCPCPSGCYKTPHCVGSCQEKGGA